MANRRKKHTVLGGIKVSSKQLSEWGKSGGRPKVYSSNAERARAFRLRKKQEKFGENVELRKWRKSAREQGVVRKGWRGLERKKPPTGSLKVV